LPSLDFEQGLEKTVDWYLSNQKWLERVLSGDYEKYYDSQYSKR
jgi:dTDP-glucose 4,6-dehydratase